MANSSDPMPPPNLVALAEIVRTDELWKRNSRPPDYAKENRALAALVQALADAPATILQTLANTILTLVDAGSAGLSLLTKDGKHFYWAAIAGGWRPHLGGGTPRDFGPCGDVLDANQPVLFSHWERRYPYLAQATPLAEEGLLVPFHVGGKAVGTIWAIAHEAERKFDTEDLRLLQSLGRFASAAYQAVQFQHAEVLIDELNHRVKNTLATVQSIAAHTLTAPSDTESRARFDARLIALSRTHDLLSRTRWEGAPLLGLLRHEAALFPESFLIEAPDIELRPKQALAFSLAFHELVANAAKHGALSLPKGKVRVTASLRGEASRQVLFFSWTESGGPPVAPPERKGFGTTIIQSGLALELDAKVALEFHPEGLRCTIEIPFAGER